jgi:primase-polymerase (primpol)-like protein
MIIDHLAAGDKRGGRPPGVAEHAPAVAPGPKPAALPVVPDAVPEALRRLDRWVLWGWRLRGGDWTKPPLTATLRPASSTDPATWTTFAMAVAAYERHRGQGADGIGLALNLPAEAQPRLDPCIPVGIDLDKVRDPETGELQPWAAGVVRSLGTYAEASPSGRGVRAFAFATLPPEGRKRGPVELYERGRYLTVTGRQIDGTPATVEGRQAAVADLHAAVFGAPRQAARPAGRPPADLPDAELVGRCRRWRHGAGDRFGRLWDGDRSGHASASEADAALMHYLRFATGGDEARSIALFRQSGLYREGKCDRRDYLPRTFAFVAGGGK